MPTSNTPTDDKTTKAAPPPAEVAPKRYEILSSGVTAADLVGHYRGEILTADQIGDETRIAKLLRRGAIKAVDDAADR